MRNLCLLVLWCLAAACVSIQAPPLPPAPKSDELAGTQQILWQRSLEDALALSQASARPLLVVLNMDGESASERIVRERYRDPQFVEWTRSFVCVVGSVFRHSLVDHDANGARVPCPRLGEVTCGEHIALEPQIFERYLKEPRIAPRHALIGKDGQVLWDLYLLFDLRDLDQALAKSAQQAGGPFRLEARAALARARSHRERLAYERMLESCLHPERELEQLLAQAPADNAGLLSSLRALALRAEAAAPEFSIQLAQAAQRRGVGAAYADMLRERLQAQPASSRSPALRGGRARHALGLAECASSAASTRTWLLSAWAIGLPEERALMARALRRVLAPGEFSRLEQSVASMGGPLDARRALQLAQALPLANHSAPAKVSASVDELESAMVAAEADLRAHETDPAHMARYARASLALARARIASGSTRDIVFLLQDARDWLLRAAERGELSVDDELALAEAHYRQAEFVEQERAACRALARLGKMPAYERPGEKMDAQASLETALRLRSELDASAALRECLRWVGDGAARNLSARVAPFDVNEELGGLLRGADALALVALASDASESDFAAIASFYAAVGEVGLSLAWYEWGLTRAPQSAQLRSAYLQACWQQGALERLCATYQALFQTHRADPVCAWYAGSAFLFRGEDARRREAPALALEAYGQARSLFAAAEGLYRNAGEEALAAGSREQQGRANLGIGFAQLIAEDRASAAEFLVQAIERAPALEDARDGLERETVDLLDQCLEWRTSGFSPVDAPALLERLLQASQGRAIWALRIADTQLREARRSVRRGELGPGLEEAEEAIDAARLARQMDNSSAASERALLYALWQKGEVLLRLGQSPASLEALSEACQLAKLNPPLSAEQPELERALAELNARLGELAPAPREGR